MIIHVATIGKQAIARTLVSKSDHLSLKLIHVYAFLKNDIIPFCGGPADADFCFFAAGAAFSLAAAGAALLVLLLLLLLGSSFSLTSHAADRFTPADEDEDDACATGAESPSSSVTG